MAHTKVTKTYSQNTGAANTFSYSGSFDVFKATEVKVELDNVALTYTASTINESASPREYSVDTSAKTIHIGGANLSSGVVIIRPETDMGAPTPRADYTPGASITSADLNNNQLQLMRKAMEYDEQKLASTGGTMTGHLTMGEDQTIVFEGATDDAYETTLTVADPTADNTITIPNVSGTVVTTGDTATVTATMLAANSVDSSELVAGSIDNSHLADDAVNSDEIASGAVDLDHMSANSVGEHQYVDASIKTAHIANDQIDSQHYAAGSIDNEHMASDSIDSAQYVDGSIDLAHMSVNSVSTDQYVDNSIQHVHLQNDIIDGDNIQDDVINSEHIAAGAIDNEHMSADSIDSAQYVDGSIDSAHIANDQIDSQHYAAGSIDLEHMSSASVDSDNIVDDTIVNADINSSAAISLNKLANVSSGQVIVGSGSNVPTAVAMSGDVAIAAGGATTIQANSVEIGMIGCEQTTISDSDSHIPTSGAVVDYVAAQIAPIGGLEVIADDESFPNTIPNAGVVISIADCAGLSVNSSGVSTNADALDNSTITINGFPSELRGGVNGNADPYVFASGAGLMVKSTGSSQTYDYHQALIREADFVQLSDDISDFNSRYRIGTKTADNASSNDDGDLFFDTGANKMYVYDGAYNSGGTWKEVTSAGDFKFLGIKTNGQAHDGSLAFDNSATQFDLFDGSSDASITSAAQLIVVLNGVVQKPNSGTYSGSEEGFYLDGSDGIRFCTAPPSNSVCFVTQIGSAVALNEPADNTVSSAKIQADAINGSLIADDAVGAEHIEVLDSHLQLADSCNIKIGTGNDLQLYHASGHSYITNSTGDLKVYADNFIVNNADNSENKIRAVDDGAVELYHNAIKTFETQANGITVLGPEGGDAELRLKADEGDDNADLWRINADTGGVFQIQNYTAGSWEANIECNGNGNVELLYDNSIKLETFSGGCKVYSDLSVRGIEGGDAVLSLVSDEGDDNGDNWRLITAASAENFSIQNWNGSSWETNVQLAHNGAVDLYHNGTKTLNTTTLGVEVKGGNTGASTELQIYGNEGQRGVLALAADDGDDNADHWQFQARTDGNLNIQNFNSGSWANSLLLQGGAAAKLYHNGDESLVTLSSGVEIKDTSDTTVEMKFSSSGGTIGYIYGNTDQSHFGLLTEDGEWIIKGAQNGSTSLYYDNSLKLQTGNSAVWITGDVIPETNDTYDIGKTSNKWDDVYATNGTIQTSDRNEKKDIVKSDLGLTFINAVEPVSYKFKTGSRTHYGVIAQDLETVLNGKDFAGLIKDTETGKYGIRYTELISPLIKAVQELSAEVETLKTKVAALEAG